MHEDEGVPYRRNHWLLSGRLDLNYEVDARLGHRITVLSFSCIDLTEQLDSVITGTVALDFCGLDLVL